MASVSLDVPEYDADDRAQLVLITGLALAISLVAIALVLNSAIYTHNLASRYDSPGDGVAMANADIREGAGAQIRHANDVDAGSDYSTIRSNYQGDLSDVEEGLARDAAVNGRLYRMTAAGDTQGVRIVDAASGGSTFYPRSGTPDEWTVASGARIRALRVNVLGSLATRTDTEVESQLSGGLLGAANPSFTVVLDDGTSEWEVAIYDNTGPKLMIHEEGTSTYRTCTASSTPVTLDLSAGTFAGTPCEPLSFVDDLSGPVDVRYYYGDRISGQYRMVADVPVDDNTGELGPFTDRVDAANYDYHCGDDGTPRATFYGASSSDFPRISPAIYAARVDVTYDSADISYEGTQRVAPAEVGQPPQAPRVTSFEVTEPDSDTDDGEYTVSWSTADPNGDSVTVTVEATDDDGDTTPVPSNGATVDLDDNDGPYTFTITASDGTSSRTISQTHDDDGGESGCPE